jgi:hypothetical protein
MRDLKALNMDLIPQDTNILITHSTPFEFEGDFNDNNLSYWAVLKSSGKGGSWVGHEEFSPLDYEHKTKKLTYKHPELDSIMRKISYAEGGGVYSSDSMYELKVFDGKSNELLTTKRFRARNQREANELGQDYEYEMQQKYGDYLRFVVSEAKPLMARGGNVNEGGEVGGKLSYDEFVETLRDNDRISTYTGKTSKGMVMHYLPNGHPFLGTKFTHKNKRKAYNEYLQLGKKIGYSEGGEVEDFSEFDFQVGDKLDLGSKGIKYFKQYDGEKIIVVDSKADLKTSKGSSTYPSSVKKVLNRK